MRKTLPAALALCLLALPARAADPPEDAKKVLADLEKEIAAIEAKAQADVKARKAKAAEALKALQGKYTKAGALDEAVAVRDLARSLDGPPVMYRGDPGNLRRYRGQRGPLYFEITGGNTGSLWGTDEYTDDSTLALAAVHAGVLKAGQTGLVKVTLVPGRAEYSGSTRNGVASISYFEVFGGGFRVEPGAPLAGAAERGTDLLPDSMRDLRGRAGAVYLFELTGRTGGTVWGSGTYTDDSDLATAAVHAGVLKDGQKGVVKVTVLAGQDGYQGSEKNGVTTREYHAYPGSFKVEAK